MWEVASEDRGIFLLIERRVVFLLGDGINQRGREHTEREERKNAKIDPPENFFELLHHKASSIPPLNASDDLPDRRITQGKFRGKNGHMSGHITILDTKFGSAICCKSLRGRWWTIQDLNL